jgi:hypothetical protein
LPTVLLGKSGPLPGTNKNNGLRLFDRLFRGIFPH